MITRLDETTRSHYVILPNGNMTIVGTICLSEISLLFDSFTKCDNICLYILSEITCLKQ